MMIWIKILLRRRKEKLKGRRRGMKSEAGGELRTGRRVERN